jgi:hypothetical protein
MTATVLPIVCFRIKSTIQIFWILYEVLRIVGTQEMVVLPFFVPFIQQVYKLS